MTGRDVEKAIDEIWKLFRETDQRARETEKKLAKELRERDERLDKELRERDERLDRYIWETEEKLAKERQEREEKFNQERQEREEAFAKEHQEREERREKDHMEMVEGFREVKELFKETAQGFKEVEQRFKETDQKIRELNDLFTSQWGKLIEALIAPGSARIFQERGIGVTGFRPRAKQQRNGEQMEVDLLLKNDDAVVVVEVKTTLKVGHVREFLDRLNRFEEFFTEYKGRRIYAAVAGVSIDTGVDRFAYQRGLFVIGVGSDNTVRMLNDLKFKPQDFARMVNQS